MSVTIITPPPSLCMSADRTAVELLAIDAIEQEAVKSVNRVDVSANITTGIQIHFYYAPSTFIMTSAAVPDGSGAQYLAGSGTPVAAEDLIPYFKANARLNADFDITEDSGYLIFTAKKANEKFDFGANIYVANLVEGHAEVKKENYSINFKLFLENEANTGFDEIWTANLLLRPGTEIAIAPIGDKLHSAISRSVRKLLPEIPTDTVLQCKTSCRKYYFQYAESYGDPVEMHSSVTSEQYTVIHGGLSSLAQSRTSISDLISPSDPENDRFLMQGSNNLLTRPNQPQFLYFHNARATRTVDIVFEFHFFLGEEDEDDPHIEKIEGVVVEGARKYCFSTGFQNVYLDPVPEKVVKYYKVFLMDGEDRVSEEKTYTLDYRLLQYARYFLYWSSWGAYITRMTYGKGSSGFDYSNSTGKSIPQQGDPIQKGHSFTYGSKTKRYFKVATGYIERIDLIGNIDFFRSDFKYRYVPGLMLPIDVSPVKMPEIEDGINSHFQNFEYSYHFEDHSYTEGDAEDLNLTIGLDFYASSGFPTGYGYETDPTVPAWVKAITLADIARWNAILSPDPIPAPAEDQTGGFFTVPWTEELIDLHGRYGKFIVEQDASYQTVPVTISYGGDGFPDAYTFELSGIDALIHILK